MSELPRIADRRAERGRPRGHRRLATALAAIAFATGAAVLAPSARASPADALLANPHGMADTAFVYTARGVNGNLTYAVAADQADPALFRKMARAGAGVVRLVCNPLPVLDDNAASRAAAIAQIMQLVDQINAAGLNVIVDLQHWTPGNPGAQSATQVSDPHGRMALGRAQIELARALDRRPAGRVALELLNEPACKRMKGVEWPTVQASLYGVVRQASPTLPLVLTGCNGLPDDLVRLDVSRYRDDPNAIFTFHFYEPFIFTHQTTYYGGVAFRQVPFPPQPETFGMVGAVAAHMTVGTAAQNLGAANDLIIYLKSRQDNSFVAGRFREMATWADRNGIPRNRIYVGEFGTSTRLRDDDAKAIWPDMLDWLRTVSSAAASQHFAYSLWPPARPGLIFSDPETGFYRRDVLAAIGLAR